MALLDATARFRTMAQWMRENVEASSFTKDELSAAVDAVDQWVEDNQTSYNTALPAGFRTKASLTQKTMLLAFVLWRRIGRLKSQEDL